jgi:hypothetical protein
MTVRFFTPVAQRVDQRLGDAAQAEAADGQQLAVGDDAVGGAHQGEPSGAT